MNPDAQPNPRPNNPNTAPRAPLPAPEPTPAGARPSVPLRLDARRTSLLIGRLADGSRANTAGLVWQARRRVQDPTTNIQRCLRRRAKEEGVQEPVLRQRAWRMAGDLAAVSQTRASQRALQTLQRADLVPAAERTVNHGPEAVERALRTVERWTTSAKRWGHAQDYLSTSYQPTTQRRAPPPPPGR
jgi:hypothetical protein